MVRQKVLLVMQMLRDKKKRIPLGLLPKFIHNPPLPMTGLPSPNEGQRRV